eukprot:SM000012S25316  [mRNA]  locus=s12:223131:223580:- [translate_table: standard]
MGPRFRTLLANIASQGQAQCEDMLPEAEMGMLAAYLSCLRRCVSAYLQRAQAHACTRKLVELQLRETPRHPRPEL